MQRYKDLVQRNPEVLLRWIQYTLLDTMGADFIFMQLLICILGLYMQNTADIYLQKGAMR